MAGSLTTFAALMKRRERIAVKTLDFGDNTLLSKLEMNGEANFQGSVEVVPIIDNNPQGVSRVFQTAQTNATNIGANQFLLTPGDYYGVVDLEDKAMKMARGNMGSFLELKATELEGLRTTMLDMLGAYSWGNGGGRLGVVAAISGNRITLVEPTDIGHFEKDMVIHASGDGDGSVSSHALRDGGATGIVASVNRAASWFELDDIADIPTLAVGDSLFRSGDFNGSTGRYVLYGIGAWVYVNDSPPALGSVSAAVRQSDLDRYSGVRLPAEDTSGQAADQIIKTIAARMKTRHKSRVPDMWWLNPEDWKVLETVMEGRSYREAGGGTATTGYKMIEVGTPDGMFPIMTDRHTPRGHLFGLRMENWKMSFAGPSLIHLQTADGTDKGSILIVKENSTDLQIRYLCYPNLVCNSLRNQCRAPLSS